MPPRLARLLAAVVAVALVAGALAARGALSDDVRTASDRGTDGTTDDGARYRVLCDEDLGAACDAVADLPGVSEVEVLAWDQVQDAYAEQAPPHDAWLTLDPLPAVLDYARDLGGRPAAASGDPIPIASTALVLLARGGDGCDGAWACTLDLAEDDPVGVPGDGTAAGTVVQGAAFADLVPDERGIAGLDDDDNRARLDALVDSADPLPLRPQRDAFLTQPGRYRAIVTTSALADSAVRGPRGSGLSAVALDPPVTLGVALVGLGTGGEDAVAALEEGVTGQTVREALAAAGWEGGAEATSGLPDPDVIYALREELGA